MTGIRLQKLSVKNYRSFGEKQNFVFPGADYFKPVAIIGYNNAGKSNLLNAIKYGLYETVREDTFDVTDFHDTNWDNNPCFSVSFNINIEDDRLLPDHAYKNVVMVNVENNNIVSVSDYCDCYIGNAQYSKKWAIKQKAPIYYINFHNIKEEISTQKTSWGNLKSFLAKHIKKLVNVDQVMKGKKENFQHLVKAATDDVLNESQLKVFIKTIQTNYQQNLRNNNCYVDFGLPHYEDIFLKMLFKIGLNNDVDNLIPLENFGDGFVSMFVMAVIQAIVETNVEDRCLFLFEEPETFLHENHQEYFYRMVLCGLAEKGHQVIYTTHSDKMIDAFDTKGIIRLEMDHNNQSIKKYNNVDDFSNPLTDLDAAELVEPINMERFNEYIKTVEPNLNRMLFSKKVILVEGPNDILVYKEVIRKKTFEIIQDRDDILNKEKFADTFLNFENISFVCHHGKATALYIVELCKHFQIDYYLINDWDFELEDLSIGFVKDFETLDALKESHIYINSDRKSMITTNRKLLEIANQENLHFNVKRLEEVIGYANNDKNSLKIWNHITSDDFVVTDFLYPETLNLFLNIDKLHQGQDFDPQVVDGNDGSSVQ